MKKSLRLALLACASFIGLAYAAPALAAYRPILRIEQSNYRVGAPATIDVLIAIPQDDDATAKLTFFSPAGYTANLGAAPGTTIGAVAALVKAKALGNAPLTLAGDVVVANPTDATIQAAALRCTGGTTHASIWVLNTQLQGQTVAIPVFVDRSGPYVQLQVCLPSPDIPESAGGARFGAQLVAADFTIRGVFRSATRAGGHEWAGIYTPYTAGTATPNPTGSVQWRTWVGLPSSLTLAKAKSKTGLKLVGRLTVRGIGPQGVRLDLYSGRRGQPAPNATSSGSGKRVARTRALARTGRYTIARRSVKSTTFFQMRFENYLTECTTTLPGIPAVRCAGEDIAPLTSNQVRATKAKKKKRPPRR